MGWFFLFQPCCIMKKSSRTNTRLSATIIYTRVVNGDGWWTYFSAKSDRKRKCETKTERRWWCIGNADASCQFKNDGRIYTVELFYLLLFVAGFLLFFHFSFHCVPCSSTHTEMYTHTLKLTAKTRISTIAAGNTKIRRLIFTIFRYKSVLRHPPLFTPQSMHKRARAPHTYTLHTLAEHNIPRKDGVPVAGMILHHSRCILCVYIEW